MKKKLNFITLLIGVAAGLGFVNSEVVSRFKEGFNEGRASVRDSHVGSTMKSYFLEIIPVESYSMPNNLFNKKSGELIPARIREATVRIPIEKANGLDSLWMFPCSVLGLTGFIMVVFNFLRIIFAVNKSIIFEWINVKRLRRMGIGFVMIFVVSAIISTTSKYAALELIEIENYKIINSSYESSLLVLGMIAFLVAEIFAVGLRLREEQELTI